MQFIDLKAQYRHIQADVDGRMQQVLAHGQFLMGPEVTELESRLAKYTGAKHCIALSSGTDALMLALMALGIKEGDEVITAPFSFIATASMIKMVGATPVFVDIDPKTYNINPALIEQAITPKTKAILPVNLYGQCADYDAIQAIAKKHHLYIVEDAAQSFGATYKGKQSCTLGTIGCTSFFPSKPLGCYGDGGACFTDDDALALKISQIRNHGQDRRYHHIYLGVNARMDTLQAAILLSKLDVFNEELVHRAEVATWYKETLSHIPGVTLPYVDPNGTCVFAQYTIRVADRDKLAEKLAAQQIPTSVHYPLPINKQPIFVDIHGDMVFVNSDEAAKHVLSLPFHPYLEKDSVQKIAKAIAGAL